MGKGPILAPSKILDLTDPKLKYPLLASCKLDGNRFLVINGKWYTRSMKLQPNVNLSRHCQILTKLSEDDGWVFDGELYDDTRTFPQLQSLLRSKNKELPITVRAYVFEAQTFLDWQETPPWGHTPFLTRHHAAMALLSVHATGPQTVRVVKQTEVSGPVEALVLYEKYLAAGEEGMILRDPDGRYKKGRCTINEGNLFKFKAFGSHDGKIIEVIERRKLKPDAKGETNELGRTSRSFKQEDYEPAGTLGAFRVEMVFNGEPVICKIGFGKGTDMAARQEMWNDRDNLLGQICEFKSMTYGAKAAPRMGGFLRLRPDRMGIL